MEQIIKRMQHFAHVSDGTLAELSDALEPCRFAKRHLLIKEGHKANAAYFIERGMTRSFWLVDGEEITTSFSTEGSIVFSMDEIYYGQPPISALPPRPSAA